MNLQIELFAITFIYLRELTSGDRIVWRKHKCRLIGIQAENRKVFSGKMVQITTKEGKQRRVLKDRKPHQFARFFIPETKELVYAASYRPVS